MRQYAYIALQNYNKYLTYASARAFFLNFIWIACTYNFFLLSLPRFCKLPDYGIKR